MKVPCLIVVGGGIADSYAPAHVDCRIIDLDRLGDDDAVALPRGIGFEKLVEDAGLVIDADYVWVDPS